MKQDCSHTYPGKIFLSFLLFSLMLAWGAATACSHTLYIQPTRYLVNPGGSIPFFFCYGHYVPFADGLRGEKLGKVQVLPPDGKVQTVQTRKETGLHSYMVKYDVPGIWGLTAETTPGYYTMYKDTKGRMHHAIKSLESIKGEAAEIMGSFYVKQYAKSYVKCGSATGAFPGELGLPLELVPQTDIFSLKPGDTLKLGVYLDGKPFEGEGNWDATYMGYSTLMEDNFYPHTKVTGSSFSIPLPNAGRWFIRYTVTTDAPEQDKDKYRQLLLSASLTLQIDNERKSPSPRNERKSPPPAKK